MTTKLTLGLRRLLKLADILDTADAEHRKRGEPTYDQGVFASSCGTPACALGHWAAAHRRRWYFEDRWGISALIRPVLIRTEETGIAAAESEFQVSVREVLELFDTDGCGNARTAKQAARYIRRFVARKQKELT